MFTTKKYHRNYRQDYNFEINNNNCSRTVDFAIKLKNVQAVNDSFKLSIFIIFK